MIASKISSSIIFVILFIVSTLGVCCTLELANLNNVTTQKPSVIVNTSYDESQQVYQVEIVNDYALGLEKEQTVSMSFSINAKEYNVDLEEWSSDITVADYGHTDENTYYVELFDCASPSLDGWLADEQKSTIKFLYMGQDEPTIKINSIIQNEKPLLKQSITI